MFELATLPHVWRSDLLAAVVVILDIIAIVSVIAGRGSLLHKVVWTLLILLLPILGMILYFIFGRSPADAT
jgi:hypothetical protein